MKRRKGRIVDLYKGIGGVKYIVQGIKKDKQAYYNHHFFGSNGSYLTQDSTFQVIYAKVSVYDFENKTVEVDVRDIVIEYFGWERVSDNRIVQLQKKLIGKKVILLDGDVYSIENLDLLLE